MIYVPIYNIIKSSHLYSSPPRVHGRRRYVNEVEKDVPGLYSLCTQEKVT